MELGGGAAQWPFPPFTSGSTREPSPARGPACRDSRPPRRRRQPRASAARSEQVVSLVWTGPSTSVAGLCRTHAVLSTLVASARESLVLVSFTTHGVADLTAGLADAAARGIAVTVILETPDDPGGPLSLGAGHPFEPLRPHARFYRWPVEAREAFFARTAWLHAKCVIADRSSVLITSANLTSAGINDNIELGVPIEGGPLPAQLSRHIEILAEGGPLPAQSSRHLEILAEGGPLEAV